MKSLTRTYQQTKKSTLTEEEVESPEEHDEEPVPTPKEELLCLILN